MRTQVELPNDVAVELAGSQDAVLCSGGASGMQGVPAREPADVRRRGERDARRRAGGARALRADLPRPSDRPRDDCGGDRRAGRARVARAGAGGRRLAASQPAGNPEDDQPEALRGLGPREHGHVRRGAGGHRKDVPRGGDGGRRACAARGQPRHPHAARGGGRRAPGLPAGRPDGQGRPIPAPRCSTRCTTCSIPRRSLSTSSAA